MPAIRLSTKRVEKPWGRRRLWPGFPDPAADEAPVGEVWFEAPPEAAGGDPELLIKYLFTSDKLSVQDHPTDREAHARGHKRGKDEAWVVLAAEPHATIAIGTQEVMTKEELRQAALDGSIADKLVWHGVRKDDFYYSPAGTVHAIGPGLVLVEVQQNVDLTYRLYDYGSDRELHLDDGIAVANPVPYVAPHVPEERAPGRLILADGPAFVLERWNARARGVLTATGGPLWLVPLAGKGTIGNDALEPGGVWLLEGEAPLALEDGIDLLVAYAGAEVIDKPLRAD